jgi:hypothetical protein
MPCLRKVQVFVCFVQCETGSEWFAVFYIVLLCGTVEAAFLFTELLVTFSMAHALQ